MSACRTTAQNPSSGGVGSRLPSGALCQETGRASRRVRNVSSQTDGGCDQNWMDDMSAVSNCRDAAVTKVSSC